MKKDNSKLVAGILFVIFFILYAITCQREVGFTDAGELAGACITLGVAHPTGYPLFIILGNLWSHVPNPFSAIMWMNLFASFWVALSVAMLYLLLKDLLANLFSASKDKFDFASIAGAAFFGATYTAWSQAGGIEVYPLQIFLFITIIYLFLKTYAFEKSLGVRAYIWAFALGLGFANHMTTVLLAPAFLFFFFKRSGEKFDFSKNRLKEILPLIAPFMLGISLYMYLPIRAIVEPAFNWGGVSRSFDKFLYHATGKQFQVWMFTGSGAMKANFNIFAKVFFSDFIWTLFIPIIVGAYYTFKKNREIFYFVLLLILGCLFYSLNYSIHDIDSYFALAIIATFILFAVGARVLIDKYSKIALAVFGVAFIATIAFNYPKMDESKNYLVSDYTNATVANLEPNALIISSQWDYFVSAFWYKQKIEGLRPDVAIIDQELLRRTWYPAQLKKWYPEIFHNSDKEYNDYLSDLELFESGKPFDNNQIQSHYEGLINSIIENNYAKRPIYVTAEILQKERGIGAKYNKRPAGFAIRLTLDTSVAPAKFDVAMLDRFAAFQVDGRDTMNYEIKALASSNLTNLSAYNLFAKDTLGAVKIAELALKLNKKNSNASAILARIKK